MYLKTMLWFYVIIRKIVEKKEKKYLPAPGFEPGTPGMLRHHAMTTATLNTHT